MWMLSYNYNYYYAAKIIIVIMISHVLLYSPNFRVAFVTFADIAVVHLNLTRTGDRSVN